MTAWVLPDVAPLCHSSWRERLKKWISPVSRVRAQRLGVHVRQRQDLAGAPVLDDARNQPPLIEYDLGVVHGARFQVRRSEVGRWPRASPLGTWTISNQYCVQVRITSTSAPNVTGLVMNELTPRS